VEDALSQPGLYVAELSSAILIESCELPGPCHGDPADQIIVASARHHHALLITKDRRLHDYPNVQCRW
jgi:PIN domain nuclease of toxin-antitoxin system